MAIIEPILSCKTNTNGKEWEYRFKLKNGDETEKRNAERFICGDKTVAPSTGSLVMAIMGEIKNLSKNDLTGLKERCSCMIIEGKNLPVKGGFVWKVATSR